MAGRRRSQPPHSRRHELSPDPAHRRIRRPRESPPGVAARTREFGVRITLGASSGCVLSMVVGQGVSVVGATVGLIGVGPKSTPSRAWNAQRQALDDLANAASYYAKCIDRWKDADPELQPRVAEAKTRVAQIQKREAK